MSLLTDSDLNSILCYTPQKRDSQRQLLIYPFNPERLTPIGYDLAVGEKCGSDRRGPLPLKEGDNLTIEPGEMVLITTLENILMPHDKTISALIMSKVSVVSKGLSHISTTIDPDWQGHLLLTTTNLSNEPVTLAYGAPFCTLVFFQNKTPAEKSSGYDAGRTDFLYVNLAGQFERTREQEKRRRKKERRQRYFPMGIILIAILIGFYFYFVLRTDPSFSAVVVAAGVALAEAYALVFGR